MNWSYKIGGGSGVFELPQDPNCTAGDCPHYINNLSNTRYFTANAWVGSVKSSATAFNTELNYDFLKVGLDGFTPATASGNLGFGWWFNITTGASFQSNRAVIEFDADYSVTKPGIWLAGLEVCTFRTSPDTAAPNVLVPRRRYNGVLLGTNDVVYYQIPVGYGTVSLDFHRLTLWSEGGSNDFDLYARCNAFPTQTQYDWRSYSSDSQEYLSINACQGTIYVAVASYNGSGAFSLVHNYRGYFPPIDQVLTAGSDFTPTPAETAVFTQQLREACRLFYGATEGEFAFNWTFNPGSCSGVNVCFTHQPGQRSSSHTPGMTTIRQDDWGVSSALRHEMGHGILGLPDEYQDVGSPAVSQSRCGHTVMSVNETGTNNNFCVGIDHARDINPAQTPMPGLSGWQTLYNSSNTTFYASAYDNTTLDNFSYLNFDFNSVVGE